MTKSEQIADALIEEYLIEIPFSGCPGEECNDRAPRQDVVSLIAKFLGDAIPNRPMKTRVTRFNMTGETLWAVISDDASVRLFETAQAAADYAEGASVTWGVYPYKIDLEGNDARLCIMHLAFHPI